MHCGCSLCRNRTEGREGWLCGCGADHFTAENSLTAVLNGTLCRGGQKTLIAGNFLLSCSLRQGIAQAFDVKQFVEGGGIIQRVLKANDADARMRKTQLTLYAQHHHAKLLRGNGNGHHGKSGVTAKEGGLQSSCDDKVTIGAGKGFRSCDGLLRADGVDADRCQMRIIPDEFTTQLLHAGLRNQDCSVCHGSLPSLI